jgi:hypothetical protein
MSCEIESESDAWRSRRLSARITVVLTVLRVERVRRGTLKQAS